MSSTPVYYEATPNPQTMKFLLGQRVVDDVISIDDPLRADVSPLARKLFGFPWTAAVMIGPDFVTVTKQDWVSWDVLAEPLSDLIREHRDNNEGFLLSEADRVATDVADDENPDDPEIVRKIKRVLNQEIRPAVAMDGGDITFAGFQDGVLTLNLRGSCAGCPSSMMTLKQGIETRLSELFPEVKEVVAAN